jgi:hypothetical protein
MPTLSDLHNIHLRELDLTLAESDLLLQKDGGLDGELKTSGSLCEIFIRSTLTKYIVPGHFRVTGGYIATPTLLAQGKNLPQCDVLIADNHLPSLLRLAQSTIEVLPQEAVIGVIEAKRTLTRKSLGDALDHLANVVQSTGRAHDFKTDKDLNGANKYVLFHNHSSNKPLLGVIAMKSGLSNFEAEAVAMIQERESLVDFVWTLDGNALVPAFQTQIGQLLYFAHSARPETKTWTQFSTSEFLNANSSFYKLFSGSPIWAPISTAQGYSRATVFAKMIGVLTLTLSRIFPGRVQENEINEYFLQ